MPACHPYEPGFAACVGYETPTPLYPYGPGLPTLSAPDARVPSRLEDELYLLASAPVTVEAQSAPVPEPAVALLLSLGVLALCARWRFRC